MKKYYPALAVVLILIAAGRIVSTYTTFNHTIDAPIHIACGLEWLEHGTYTLEAEHPPLSRIVTAIGPYLAGIRLPENYQEIWMQYRVGLGNIALTSDDQYFRNLSLARMGVLMFFLLSAGIVWLWARKEYGTPTALTCTALYTTLPPVLAHGGVAATDMTLTGNLIAALFAFILWLHRPSIERATLMGLTFGLSLLSKLTTMLFYPSCVFVVIAWYWFLKRKTGAADSDEQLAWRDMIRHAGIAAAVAFLVVWAGFQFDVGALRHSKIPDITTIEWISWYSMPLRNWLASIALYPIFPAPGLFEGVQDAAVHGRTGHDAFFMGEMRRFGIWYFYPVLLLIKTPLAFLILSMVGIVALVQKTRETGAWQKLTPVLMAGIILALVLPTTINIGIRHILIIYPLLALVAGAGAFYLWRLQKFQAIGRGVVVVLMSWHMISSALAHPDYLSYFNEVVRSKPERWVVGSGLDWGQDLYRLSRTMKERDISLISLAYFGTAEPALVRYSGGTAARTRPTGNRVGGRERDSPDARYAGSQRIRMATGS